MLDLSIQHHRQYFPLTQRVQHFLRCVQWAVLAAYVVLGLGCCGLIVLAIYYPQFALGLFLGAVAGLVAAGLFAASARGGRTENAQAGNPLNKCIGG